LWTKPNLSNRDQAQLLDIIILGFHGTLEPPPRLELATIFLGTTKSDTGNFLYRSKGMFLVLNDTKTSGKTGATRRRLSNKMQRLFAKYIKATGRKIGDRLILNKTGFQFTPQSYSRRIKKIFKDNFDKNIGASLLRTIYLSEKYKNAPTLLDMQVTANSMGHSVGTALKQYVKIHSGIVHLN
jgi:hypothetical protein